MNLEEAKAALKTNADAWCKENLDLSIKKFNADVAVLDSFGKQPVVPLTPGMKEVFFDDFDGTSINKGNWAIYGDTNFTSLARYGQPDGRTGINGPAAITVANSLATFTSVRLPGQYATDSAGTQRLAWQTGFLGTREVGKYFPKWGKFSVKWRVNTPVRGFWPAALWLRSSAGSSTAEIDVMEVGLGTDPAQLRQALHFLNDSTGKTDHNIGPKLNCPQDFASDANWHVTTVEIIPTPDGKDARITYFLDGRITYSITTAGTAYRGWIGKITGWDLAICSQTECWSGTLDVNGGPYSFDVDWVQVQA